MGQKANPIGLRTIINKKLFQSNWFASKKQFSKYLFEDFKVREFIQENNANAGIGRIDIARAPGEIRIAISCSRPGILIGKKGENMEKMKVQVAQHINRLSKRTKGEDRHMQVFLEVVEIKKPEANAKVIAESIAQQLKGRVSYRRAVKKASELAMGTGHVKGIQVKVSGRLGGAEIARSEASSMGSVGRHTLKTDIDFAQARARTTYGIIGIAVTVSKHKKEVKEGGR